MTAVAKIEERGPLQVVNDREATPSLMAVLARAAADPAVDVEKMKGLYELMERSEQRDAERAFNIAMGEAQAEVRPVAADAENSQTHSKYATYPALNKALRPIYTKHGFSLSFDTGADAPESFVRVLCYVSHKAGHSRTYRVDMPADGKGARGNDVMTKTHAAGSAMQYGMRYLLKLIFNIAIGPDDDDGNSAATDMAAMISEADIAELTSLASRANVDLEKFCGYLKVDALAFIPKRKLGDARELLNIELNAVQRRAKGGK